MMPAPILTQELVKAIVNELAVMPYVSEACDLLCIDQRLVRRWLKRGAAEDRRVGAGGIQDLTEGVYRELYQKVRQARAAWTKDLVQSLRTAAIEKGNVIAALALLDRARSKHYAQKRRVEHSGRSDRPIQHRVLEITVTSREEVQALRESLAGTGHSLSQAEGAPRLP
jgi:hypothetical protein